MESREGGGVAVTHGEQEQRSIARTGKVNTTKHNRNKTMDKIM